MLLITIFIESVIITIKNRLNHTLLVSDTELYIIKHVFVLSPKLVNNSVVKWLSLNSCRHREPREVVTTCVILNRILVFIDRRFDFGKKSGQMVEYCEGFLEVSYGFLPNLCSTHTILLN